MVSFKLSALVIASGLVERALAKTGILFPLYIYPGDSCAAWTPLINSIKAYPSLPFVVVVNPDSGPGSSAQPDANYVACIPKLKASNSIVIGYVATGYGSRTVATVDADIAKYAGWGSAYRPTGIFFDETVDASEATTALTSQYSGYASTVKSYSGFTYITFNPGATPATSFYSFASTIVTAEDYSSDFTTSSLTVSSSAPASKQVVILHDAPATPSTSTINALASKGVGYIYITDLTEAENPYGAFPTQWTIFVADVAAA